jgi:ArsR family transcriptional regulator, arsenate/arsenite/antimonite-responsive transcriptional repressor
VLAGLVESRKDGRWVYYRLHRHRAAYAELLNYVQNQIAQDDSYSADFKSLKSLLATTPEEICRKQRGEMCCPSSS